MMIPERQQQEGSLDLPDAQHQWLTLIVTLADGTEICPVASLTDGDPFMPDPVRASQAAITQDRVADIVKTYGQPVGFRFEYLSQKDLVDRGYREASPL